MTSTLATKDRGVKQADFYVLRSTNHPAILVEIEFFTNKEKVENLLDHKFRHKIVKSLYNAIVKIDGI